MSYTFDCQRRHFLTTTACGLAAMNAPSLLAADDKPALKKAVKIGMVKIPGSLLEKFKLLAELGFDGVELDSPGGASLEEVRKCIAETGVQVPGVVDSVHWKDTLSDPSEEVRTRGRQALEQSLKACQDYGGTSVLLVPGVVRGGVSYEQCWERSIAEIKKVTPLADDLGLDILIENVWNDFLTDPKEMARFIDACDSKRVGAHFDTGNTVRYSPPHEWIPVLGKRIKKLDIKDYKQGPDLGAGFGAKLLEGDVDWAKVMAELKKIGYSDWGTAEIQSGDRVWLTDVAARMDKIYAS